MSIIKHVTLQKIVAHDFRYDLRIYGKVKEPCNSPVWPRGFQET